MRACKYCTAPIYPLWPNMCMALAQWPQPQAAQLLQLGLGEELIGGVHRSVVPWPETSASYSILWLLRLIHWYIVRSLWDMAPLLDSAGLPGRWFQDVPSGWVPGLAACSSQLWTLGCADVGTRWTPACARIPRRTQGKLQTVGRGWNTGRTFSQTQSCGKASNVPDSLAHGRFRSLATRAQLLFF